MTEEKQEKKAWRVCSDMRVGELEDTLNALAAEGYQAFRIEESVERGWVVIVFDPAQIAERQGKAMAETMAKLAGLPSMGPLPGPAR